jgi:uncharacterized membrane protein
MTVSARISIWGYLSEKSVVQALVAGFLFLVPIYLAILLLLKAMRSLGKLVQPLARLLPKSFPAETVISFLLVLVLCVLVGIVPRTQFGQGMRTRVEGSVLQKIPLRFSRLLERCHGLLLEPQMGVK